MLFSPVAAWAQDTPSRVEVGGQVTVSDLTYGRHALRVGGWLDINVSRQLAVETRFTRWPSQPDVQILNLAAGVRAAAPESVDGGV